MRVKFYNMQKLLLHTCCAPCTTYVNKWLTDNGFEVNALFYNPNIRPQDEYQRRLLTMESYARAVGLKVIFEKNDIQTEVERCVECYRARLKKTAKIAKELGFEFLSTTLLISPYQKIDLIKRVGEEVGEEFGVKFFYHDFRTGYRDSRQMSRAMKLYMQKYCGCKEDAYAKTSRTA